jgi:DNA-binding transcriptional ArsR family regulator
VQRTAGLLDALGDPHRLSILLALHHAGDLCVSDLAFAVGMTDSAVSHALRLLRGHGMVTADRQGRLVRYRVAGDLTIRLLDVVSAEAVGDVVLHAGGAEHGL